MAQTALRHLLLSTEVIGKIKIGLIFIFLFMFTLPVQSKCFSTHMERLLLLAQMQWVIRKYLSAMGAEREIYFMLINKLSKQLHKNVSHDGFRKGQ